MHKYSKRAKFIRDIFMMLVLLDHEEGNNLINSSMGFPTIPTLGSMVYPKEPTCKLIFNMAFEDEAHPSKFLGAVLSQCYIGKHLPARNQDEYNLLVLFQIRDKYFRQAVHITKDGFIRILQQICLNPVFYSKSHQTQLPIGHQLALMLKRLGSNGNGASLVRLSCNLNIERGTVIKIMRFVICAINDCSPKYTVWPGKE
jgi:hypothetical protein